MNPQQLLTAARELIKSPDQWTQGYMARNEKDNPVDFSNANAVKFCMMGALLRVSPSDTKKSYRAHVNARALLTHAIGQNCVVFWNDSDSRTHQQVLEAYDQAIAQAGKV